MEKMMKLHEVSVVTGISPITLNYWYRFKRQFPENEWARKLPDYTKIGNTRYWTEADAWGLLEFRKNVPHGRNGVMGAVTQKWQRKRKVKDGKESDESTTND